MRRKKGNSEGISFWQSATDLISAFLLIVLLILMLLLLMLVVDSMGKSDGENEYKGVADSSKVVETVDHKDYDEQPTTRYIRPNNSSGGGQGGGEGKYPENNPGEEEGGMKSAVFAILYDGETGKNLLESGVAFQLYRNEMGIQTLYTYYPEKIAYNSFATKKDGTFYLPEKIMLDTYFFKQISEIKGYDNAENVGFDLKDTYDWPNAYTVKIPVYPSKNIVRIKMTDSETNEGVFGGSFKLVAAEDIITVDGTVRYKFGEVADTLVCDENGYAESKEVYLGKYLLKPDKIPFGYAAIKEDTEVVVEKRKNDTQPEIHEYECEKTKMIVYLNDELNAALSLSGATYELTCDQDTSLSEICKTDATGRIVISDLIKNCTYYLKQVTSTGEYSIDTFDHSFVVDENGWIDGGARAEMLLTNKIIRLDLNVVDAFVRVPIKNSRMELYTSDGTLLIDWISSDISEEVVGLSPGNYYLLANGKNRKDIYVSDTAKVQHIYYTIWSLYGLIAYILAGLILLSIIIILIVKKKKKDKKKKAEKEKQKNKENTEK